MIPLSVPESQREPLLALANLDDETFNQLREVLSPTELVPSLEELRSSLLSEDLDGSEHLDRGLLLDSLLGIENARLWHSSSSTEIATQVAYSRDLSLSDEARERFVSRLSSLLESKTLEALAKAIDIVTEHTRIYLRSRILTDIRPVYRDEPDRPAAFVLAHTLKIDVREDFVVKSIYIALDEGDLRQLGDVLEREMVKSAGLREQLAKLEVELLDVVEGGQS